MPINLNIKIREIIYLNKKKCKIKTKYLYNISDPIPAAVGGRAVGAVLGDADGRGDGEEDPRPGQEHPPHASARQHHAGLVGPHSST